MNGTPEFSGFKLSDEEYKLHTRTLRSSKSKKTYVKVEIPFGEGSRVEEFFLDDLEIGRAKVERLELTEKNVTFDEATGKATVRIGQDQSDDILARAMFEAFHIEGSCSFQIDKC